MKSGVVATIHPVVVACAVTRAFDWSHWCRVMPKNPSRRKYARSRRSTRRNWRRTPTNSPSTTIPIAKRAHTSATGVSSRSAILVATKEAPHAVTAIAALRRFPASGGNPVGSRLEGGTRMTQTQLLKKVQRAHWRSLQRLLRRAYQEGFNAGLTRAHRAGRRGRTIRPDPRGEGLLRRVERPPRLA